MKKDNLSEKILEILKNQAAATSVLLDAFLSDYHTSYKKLRNIDKIDFSNQTNKEIFNTQVFYSILNRLKKQGLVEKDKRSGCSIWSITKNGLKRFKMIKSGGIFSARHINYSKEQDNKLKLIIFDIPEKEKHKRAWLRSALTIMGFKLLQRSVWVGQNKIPVDLIKDLKERKMLSYVHIFEITKEGTISRVSQ